MTKSLRLAVPAFLSIFLTTGYSVPENYSAAQQNTSNKQLDSFSKTQVIKEYLLDERSALIDSIEEVKNELKWLKILKSGKHYVERHVLQDSVFIWHFRIVPSVEIPGTLDTVFMGADHYPRKKQ